MAKKKPQYMYELLGQKVQEAKEAAAAKVAPVKPETGQTSVPVVPRRRFIPAEHTPVPAPGPVGTGQERALEDVITLRRDTAIVGILLVIVVVVVAFVVGRSTAPTYIEEKGPEPGLRPGVKPEKEREAVLPEEENTSDTPARDGVEQPGELERPVIEPPPAEPKAEFAVYLLKYGMSKRYIAEDVCKFLIEEGYAAADIVEKDGQLQLRVPGFKTREEAERAKNRLDGLEYRGDQPFGGSKVVEIDR